MTASPAHIRAFVLESNRIEGIRRPPLTPELRATRTLLELDQIQVADLERFVDVCQPGAVLRRRPGMDVTIGSHTPPPGGSRIVVSLEEILRGVTERWHPYPVHCAYETLHPFMDGNGRSGRALWAWQMVNQGIKPGLKLGFLQSWYFMSLEHGGDR